MRVRIIGGPGSGKTYVAKKLSKLLKIKSHDLDEFYFDSKANDYETKTDEKERNQRLRKLVNHKNWVIEGVYNGDWVTPTFKKATIIIILKPHKIIRSYHIVKRYLLRKIGLASGKKETWKDVTGLLSYNWQYDENNLRRIRLKIKGYKNRAVEFREADKAVEYLTDQV